MGFSMHNGFIQISRDLFDHPCFEDAPANYWKVIMIMMKLACFKDRIFDDHGKKMILKPGEFCCTIRHLAELCDIPKTSLERVLSVFLKNKICGQEVRHTKTVFSISSEYLLQNNGTIFGTRSGQDRDTNKQSNKAISCTTPTPLKKIKVGGGGFYDCLKEVDIPEYRKVKLSEDFPLIRVELAVKYIQHEEYIPTKGIIQTLLWHCKQPTPPEYAEKPKAKWEILAHKHNEIYREYNEKGFLGNQELIKEQKMWIWQINNFVPISLGNSIEVLKKDFEQAEKEFKIAMKNRKAQTKIEKMENFA